jgi:hypothetical protein
MIGKCQCFGYFPSFSIADTHRLAFFYYGNEIAVIRNANLCLASVLQPKAEAEARSYIQPKAELTSQLGLQPKAETLSFDPVIQPKAESQQSEAKASLK